MICCDCIASPPSAPSVRIYHDCKMVKLQLMITPTVTRYARNGFSAFDFKAEGWSACTRRKKKVVNAFNKTGAFDSAGNSLIWRIMSDPVFLLNSKLESRTETLWLVCLRGIRCDEYLTFFVLKPAFVWLFTFPGLRYPITRRSQCRCPAVCWRFSLIF